LNLPFLKMNIVQVFMRTALHILTLRLYSLFSLTEIASPSVLCSPDVARFNVEDTMKFMMNMQKLPRLMSVPIKKKPWKKMDNRCRRSETIFLLRLDLRSHLFLLNLTTQQRRILRGVG